ncbi:hypothetical protein AB0L88_13915 [Saccharopolyspora shandongensis]|uniref:hypothetical protein n=1 Tax=Saccharopolyspora shandongensis TaxID=418495 RepID=UPI0034312E66
MSVAPKDSQPGPVVPGTEFARAQAVADAVLYEGYLLYPYRRSSGKNRVRWQFGIVAPRRWVEADGPVPPVVAGSVESWQQQTECLFHVRGGQEEAEADIRLRFLRVVLRTAERAVDGEFVPVDSLDADGTRHLSTEEAAPQQFDLHARLPELLDGGCAREIRLPAATGIEPLGDSGRILRRSEAVAASLSASAEQVGDGAYRLRVRVENLDRGVDEDASRPAALRHSLVATHVLISGRGLEFCSMMDPPGEVSAAVAASRNIHAFPVLIGDDADLVLSSPILLPDHPEVAPESPGDLHDATEIDEMLSLLTLALTDAEKSEARATDPRAAEILDRVDGMPSEVLARLHGTMRSLRDTTGARGEGS